jgi:hypothetical protein
MRVLFFFTLTLVLSRRGRGEIHVWHLVFESRKSLTLTELRLCSLTESQVILDTIRLLWRISKLI